MFLNKGLNSILKGWQKPLFDRLNDRPPQELGFSRSATVYLLFLQIP
jgi:hypothetical protein